MDFMLLLLYPCISTLVLYALDKKYSYKAKLIKLFGSTSKYKVSLLIITLAALFFYTFAYDKSPFSSPIFVTIYFSYLYLVQIPQELR